MKKSKLSLAIALMVQSVTFLALFCILCVKKKSLAAAFLVVSAACGVTGTVLLSRMKKEIAGTVVEFDDDFEVDEAALKADLDRHDGEETED